jgi:hypothetical protein
VLTPTGRPITCSGPEIEFDVRLWSLLHGDIVLPADAAKAGFTWSGTGSINWSRRPVADAAVKQVQPQHRHRTLISRLELSTARSSSTMRNLDLSGSVSAAGQAGAEAEARLSVKGKLENQPLTLQFVSGSALMLRETAAPYPSNSRMALARPG